MISDIINSSYAKLPRSLKIGVLSVSMFSCFLSLAHANNDDKVYVDRYGDYVEREAVDPAQSYRYGKALMEVGENGDAINEFQKVYELFPESEYADDALAMHTKLSLKHWSPDSTNRWGKLWLELKAKHPNSPYIDKLEPMVRRARSEQASYDYKQHQKQQQEKIEDMLDKGWDYLTDKEFAKAEKIYLKIIEMDPTEERAYGRLYDVYKWKEPRPPKKEMINLFEKGARYSPEYKSAFNNKIAIIEQFGEPR